MLVDEEEARELGIRGRHRDEPWRGDREEERKTQRPLQASQDGQVALQQHVEEDRRARKDDAHEPLGEDRERHRRPGGEHPEAMLARPAGRLLGEEERREGRRGPEREPHVERDDAAQRHEVRARDEHQHGRERRFRVGEAHSQEPHDEDRRQAAEADVKPRGVLVLAE